MVWNNRRSGTAMENKQFCFTVNGQRMVFALYNCDNFVQYNELSHQMIQGFHDLNFVNVVIFGEIRIALMEVRT